MAYKSTILSFLLRELQWTHCTYVR